MTTPPPSRAITPRTGPTGTSGHPDTSRAATEAHGVVYGGLVFVETCRSHPEQYDVLAEGGHVVGFVHYRRGTFTVGGADYLGDLTVEPLLRDQRSSESEWLDNRIAEDQRTAWLTEAAEHIHTDMRARLVGSSGARVDLLTGSLKECT